MQRIQVFVRGFIAILLFGVLTAQAPAQISISEYRPIDPFEVKQEQAPDVNLLISYKIKTAFGARITFGSIMVRTKALTGADVMPDRMLNDLIAELGKRGLLANVKGLDRPERASITILSWEPVAPNFIYTTEQYLTPNLPD